MKELVQYLAKSLVNKPDAVDPHDSQRCGFEDQPKGRSGDHRGKVDGFRLLRR